MSNKWQGIALHAFTAVHSKLKSLPHGIIIWLLAAFVSSAVLFWHFRLDVETVVPRVICVLALLVAIRVAHRAGSYCWAAALAGIAVLFNPFVSNMLSRIVISGLYFALAATLLLCLSVLDTTSHKPALALIKKDRSPSSKAA